MRTNSLKQFFQASKLLNSQPLEGFYNEQLHGRQKNDGIGNLNTTGGRTISDVKSPSQLMSHVDQMHKEELDQLLQKLQFENLELKQAMEQKRRAANVILPNKSAPNLHNNNNNNKEKFTNSTTTTTTTKY